MKNKTRIRRFFNPTFFEQFYFFTLLIGLIPITLVMMEIIPNISMVLGKGNDVFSEWGKTAENGVELPGFIRIGILAIYFLCLFISTIWCFKNKKKLQILFLFPGYILAIISSMTLLDILDNSAAFGVTFLFVILYLIFFPFSTFHFIKRGHIRSVALFFSFLFFSFIFGIIPALFFVFTLIVLRFIFLVIKQNVETVRALTFKRFTIVFFKSLLFWLPLLLFVIPGNKMSTAIYESSINGIYTYVFDIEKEEGNTRGFKKKEFQADLDDYLNKKFAPLEGAALDAKFKKIESKVKTTVTSLSSQSGDKSEALPKAISKIYEEETEKEMLKMAPYFAKEDCGWHIFFPTSCCVTNKVKSFLFSKCLDLQKQLGNAIEKNVSKALKDANAQIQDGSKTSEEVALQTLTNNRLIFEEKVKGLKRTLYNSIIGFYNGVLLLNLIMDILLFFLIIKSFLVVFARVAFSGREELFVSLLDPDVKMGKGTIKKCGSQYTILSSNNRDFYTSRSYEPSGRPPKFTIPQKSSATLGRIRSGNYALNHVVMRNRKGSVYYNALGGTEFVEWTLKKGEEVIFNLDNFVAMSEDVQLSTIYSFRLTSLLLGRLRFTMARGPGKLVLITKGKPITSEERKGNASIPVSRIIAFQKNTRFHVHSELNVVDVFLSGVYLEKKSNDLIIIDADEKGSAKSGISKFIKSFLLPV